MREILSSQAQMERAPSSLVVREFSNNSDALAAYYRLNHNQLVSSCHFLSLMDLGTMEVIEPMVVRLPYSILLTSSSVDQLLYLPQYSFSPCSRQQQSGVWRLSKVLKKSQKPRVSTQKD